MKVAISTEAQFLEATPVVCHAQGAALLDYESWQQIEALPDKRSLKDLLAPGAASGNRW